MLDPVEKIQKAALDTIERGWTTLPAAALRADEALALCAEHLRLRAFRELMEEAAKDEDDEPMLAAQWVKDCDAEIDRRLSALAIA
jgi:hypothetical protein